MTFPKGISPKVNIIARLEVELADYDVTVLQVSHCTTGTYIGNLPNRFSVLFIGIITIIILLIKSFPYKH